MYGMTECYTRPRASYTLTPQDWDTILNLIQDGYSVTHAARAVGATRQAVYDHIKRNPEFAQAVKQSQHEGTDFFVDLMREKALDPKAGFLPNIAILKARDRATWGDHVDVRQQSILRIEIVAVPSAEELMAEDARLALSAPDAVHAVREGATDAEYTSGYDEDSST